MQKQKFGKLSEPAETVSNGDYDDQTEDALEYIEMIEMGRAIHRGERFHDFPIEDSTA